MPIIDINSQFGAYPARHRTTNYDTLLAEMSVYGVDMTCACSTVGEYFNDAEGNMETVNAAASSAGKLIPVATLNPALTLDPTSAVQSISSGPFKLIRFFPESQDWPINFAPFKEALLQIHTAAIPVMISTSRVGDATQLATLIESLGFGTPVVISGVADRTLAEAVSAMRTCKQLYLETHALVSADLLPAIKSIVGIERILFGSGASALSLGASLSYVRGSSLSDHDKTAILGDNAVMALRLG